MSPTGRSLMGHCVVSRFRPGWLVVVTLLASTGVRGEQGLRWTPRAVVSAPGERGQGRRGRRGQPTRSGLDPATPIRCGVGLSSHNIDAPGPSSLSLTSILHDDIDLGREVDCGASAAEPRTATHQLWIVIAQGEATHESRAPKGDVDAGRRQVSARVMMRSRHRGQPVDPDQL